MGNEFYRQIDLLRLVGETYPLISGYIKKVEDTGEEVFEMSDSNRLIRDPLVSVTVVAYNQEHCIRECLDSILSQRTDFPYEVIIGEDCSTDHTREICFEYQKRFPEKVRVLYSARNVGLVSNYRRVKAHQRGQYGFGIGGDDYCASPLRLQKPISYLIENPRATVAYCGAWLQLENHRALRVPCAKRTHVLRRRIGELDQRSVAARLLLGNFVTGPTAAYRVDAMRRACDKMRDLERLIGWVPSEDIVTLFYRALEGTVGYVADDLVVYRLNSGSITANKKIDVAYARMLGDSRAVLAMAATSGIDLDDSEVRGIIHCFVTRLLNYMAVTGKHVVPEYCQEILKHAAVDLPKCYQRAISGDFDRVRDEIRKNEFKAYFNRSLPYFLLRKVLSFSGCL